MFCFVKRVVTTLTPLPPLPFHRRGGANVEGNWMARRCLVEGCGKLVKAGRAVCAGHEKTEFGRVVSDEVMALTRELQRSCGGGWGEPAKKKGWGR